ncbi:hypothetical protein HKX48_009319, partial [Thoreauomyces humboldtii]
MDLSPSPTSPAPPPLPSHSVSQVREYYGFVVYLASFVIFGGYLVWSLSSDAFLHILGVYYYPTRWWAIALPVYVLGLIPFTILLFTGINFWRTPALSSYDTITDNEADVLMLPLTKQKYRKLASEDCVPEIEDIPIAI